MAVNIKSTGGVGLKNALQQLQAKIGNGAHVRVGFLENAKYSADQTPVAQVAAWNEFGTSTAPPRPFMRNTVANNQDKWGKLLAAALKSSGYETNTALATCGEKMTAQMRDEIINLSDPENAPLTNLLKDRFPMGGYTTAEFLQAVHDLANGVSAPSGKPLVWSGHMLNSVGSDVKGGSDGS